MALHDITGTDPGCAADQILHLFLNQADVEHDRLILRAANVIAHSDCLLLGTMGWEPASAQTASIYGLPPNA